MELSAYQNRYQNIRFAREGGVLEMTLTTRGGEALWGTSLTSLHNELGEAFLDIARDPENKVLLLTGVGANFIAGRDPQENYPEPTMGAMFARMYEEGVALLKNLLDVPIPIIAAVNGPVRVHAEIAVLSDIVLAAEHTVFADSAHMPHGVVPGDGVHTVWPMLLGPNRGRYFLLTGEEIDAHEAKRLGVVAEVLAADALMPRARELANKLVSYSAPALRHTRAVLTRYLRRRMQDELSQGLALEALAVLAR